MLRHSLALPLVCVMLASCFTGCDALTPQQQLEAFVEQESKNLPKDVDEYTKLVALEAKPSEIVYMYEIDGLEDEQVKASKSQFESMVRATLKESKTDLKVQIENKIKMTYIYKGAASQTELMRFTIDTWKL